MNLPPLSGGINYRDGEIIADNQLSDALNVWFKDGIIKTRPGLAVIKNQDIISDVTKNAKKVKTFPEIVSEGRMLCALITMSQNQNLFWSETVYFFWIGADGCSDMSASTPANNLTSDKDIIDFFTFEDKEKIYVFYGNGVIHKKRLKSAWNANFETVLEEELYIPTAFLHGKQTIVDNWTGSYSAVQFEGYNLICGYYKAIYTSVNRELLTDDNNHRIRMYYRLPAFPKGMKMATGKVFTAEVTDKNGVTTKHEVVLSNGFGEESEPRKDGLRLLVTTGWSVTFRNSNNQDHYLTEEDYVEDNIIFTIPYELSSESRDLVCKSTLATWFGGAVAGKRGGTRLFLGGNTKETEKARLIWSGLNNPLYFSENCYSYVGNREKEITAFGKQGEKLVIFKPDEIYYTYYAEGAEITADNLINQEVIDYDANATLFPLVTLSGSIGCDAPNSVANCGGRLVWADSIGHIYTLAYINSYNTALRIYQISEMIESDFPKERADIQSSVAAELDGYYALIIGHRAYVCDYGNTGFKYIGSFSKSGDANAKIPWYIWELPEAGLYFPFGKSLGVAALLQKPGSEAARVVISAMNKDSEADTDSFYILKESGAEIKTTEIPSFIESKHFDFGIPSRNKSVTEINISFADNGGRDMALEIMTDRGTVYSKSFCNVTTEPQRRSLGYTRNRTFRAVVPCARKICLRISSKGAIGVSDASVVYRILGGAK